MFSIIKISSEKINIKQFYVFFSEDDLNDQKRLEFFKLFTIIFIIFSRRICLLFSIIYTTFNL